jgi:hypothetical protein
MRMAEISERHEVRVRGKDNTVVFTADSADGKLVIRQEWDGKGPKQACSITLADPSELKGFFQGLRRIMASLGTIESAGAPARRPGVCRELKPALPEPGTEDREALVAKARTKNPQAFAPWTKKEEEEVARRYRSGESIEAIAGTQKRSARAIELRLERLGLLNAGKKP